MNDSQAAIRQPILHRYIGGGYTGFMPLATIDGTNTFFCSYNIGSEKAEVCLMDDQGEKRNTYALPGEHLIFDMQYSLEQDMLFLNRDHQIFGIVIPSDEIVIVDVTTKQERVIVKDMKAMTSSMAF